MAFGFQAINESGVVQVDSSNKVLEIDETINWYYSNGGLFSSEKSYTPLAFGQFAPRVSSVWAMVTRQKVLIAYTTNDGNNITQPGDATIYIMKPTGMTPAAGNGIQVYSETGELTFTSDMPLINIQYLNLRRITTSDYTPGTGSLEQVREVLVTTNAMATRPLILLNNLMRFHAGVGSASYSFGLRAYFNADNSVTYKVWRYRNSIGVTPSNVISEPFWCSLATAILRN